jgi:hypothetical protein
MRGTASARRLRPIPVLLAVAIGLASLTFVAGAEATFPGRNGQLAVSYGFTCELPVIATMRSDGTVKHELTDCANVDKPDARGPDWSPDGRRILFTRGGYLIPGSPYLRQPGIAIMNSDGSRQRRSHQRRRRGAAPAPQLPSTNASVREAGSTRGLSADVLGIFTLRAVRAS